MKRLIRLTVVCAGLALAGGLGGTLACATAGEGSTQPQAPAQAQKQEKECHHKHHRRHCKECRCHQEGEHGRWDRRERFRAMAEKLGLSDQQKAQMKEVFAKNRPQFKPLFDKLITEKREMRALIQSGSADEAAIRAEAAKEAGIEADLAVQRAQMAKQLRAVLTPGQIEKFTALQKERDRRMDEFRERKWGGL